MRRLEEEIAAYEEEKKQRVPETILKVMDDATTDLKQTGQEDVVVKVGEKAPEFSLPNHLGEERTLTGLLAESTLVISFYRGGWCPYCNLELAALQRALPEIEALGARLVAISPETPDHSLSTREKQGLAFDVLFDKGNVVAETYGLVFTLPEELRSIYEKLGIDIPAYNGDTSFRLPIPATFVIDRDGTIVYAFADADYTKRLEPSEIINALRNIQ